VGAPVHSAGRAGHRLTNPSTGTDPHRSNLRAAGVAPDVILADFHLGDQANGIDAVELIRSLHGPIPAFLVTADRSPILAATCAAAGIPILSKPVEPARLRALLAGIRPGGTSTGARSGTRADEVRSVQTDGIGQ
jgi:CheY-like chemotaxis protein